MDKLPAVAGAHWVSSPHWTSKDWWEDDLKLTTVSLGELSQVSLLDCSDAPWTLSRNQVRGCRPVTSLALAKLYFSMAISCLEQIALLTESLVNQTLLPVSHLSWLLRTSLPPGLVSSVFFWGVSDEQVNVRLWLQHHLIADEEAGPLCLLLRPAVLQPHFWAPAAPGYWLPTSAQGNFQLKQKLVVLLKKCLKFAARILSFFIFYSVHRVVDWLQKLWIE